MWIVSRVYNPTNNMAQSPISNRLHRTTKQHHTIPYRTSLFVWQDCRPPRDLQKAMYTAETSIGSDGIVARRQFSPHTNRYLVPGLSFEGGIFKEQETTFLTCLVLPNLARMFNGKQRTTFLMCPNSIVSRGSLFTPRRGPQGAITMGAWLGEMAKSPRRACRVKPPPPPCVVSRRAGGPQMKRLYHRRIYGPTGGQGAS